MSSDEMNTIAELPTLEFDPAAPWTLYHGEALRTMLRLPDACVDAMITDPPYSSGGFTRGDRMGSTSNKYVQTQTKMERPDFAGDNRDQRAFGIWTTIWLDEALRIVKPGGSVLLFSDWRQLPTVTDAVQSGGFVWRGIIPWDKGEGTRPRRGGFRAQAEYLVWATAGALREDHEEYLPGSFRLSVRHDERQHHQTVKPIELLRELVRVAPRGGLVFDPFAGSATTGVACIEQGRRFLGVEKTAMYYAVARERLEQADSRPTLFEEFPTVTEAEPAPELFPGERDAEG